MSVCYYLVCHDCKKSLWVAQDGLSGFSFYSGEPQTMKALRDFLADHALLQDHKLQFIGENRMEELEDQWRSAAARDSNNA